MRTMRRKDFIQFGIRVHKNSLLPRAASIFFPVEAITIANHIFFRDEIHSRVLRHEVIHVLQGRELGYVVFWFMYLKYWLIAMKENQGNTYRAYRDIPFEKEAYLNEREPSYIYQRPLYAWKKYR